MRDLNAEKTPTFLVRISNNNEPQATLLAESDLSGSSSLFA